MMVWNQLTYCAINPDGSVGCLVAFAFREYAEGPNSDRFGSTWSTHQTMKKGLHASFSITIMVMLFVKPLHFLMIIINN